MQFQNPRHQYSTNTIIVCILGITFFIFETLSDYLYQQYSDKSTHNLTVFFFFLIFAKMLRDKNKFINYCLGFMTIVCFVVKIYLIIDILWNDYTKLFTNHKGYVCSALILAIEIYEIMQSIRNDGNNIIFRRVDQDQVETQIGNETEE